MQLCQNRLNVNEKRTSNEFFRRFFHDYKIFHSLNFLLDRVSKTLFPHFIYHTKHQSEEIPKKKISYEKSLEKFCEIKTKITLKTVDINKRCD